MYSKNMEKYEQKIREMHKIREIQKIFDTGCKFEQYSHEETFSDAVINFFVWVRRTERATRR